jgi:hypothetical protein
LIGLPTLMRQTTRQAAVLIPTLMKELDESHATLDEPSRDGGFAASEGHLNPRPSGKCISSAESA